MMPSLSRRDFASLSLSGLSALALPGLSASVLAQSLGGQRPPSLARLGTTCASRANFRLFRRYSREMGLAGVVSVANPGGPFAVGTVFLHPWLKKEGQGLAASSLKASLPYSAWASQPADLIPNADLPQDEYICRYMLQLPWQCFIGFNVDAPSNSPAPQTAWATDVPKLADGLGVAIDWTSSNLNDPWFGGSRFIPATDASGGKAWRALIVAALNEAAVAAC